MCDVIGAGCALDIETFESSPGDCDAQQSENSRVTGRLPRAVPAASPSTSLSRERDSCAESTVVADTSRKCLPVRFASCLEVLAQTTGSWYDYHDVYFIIYLFIWMGNESSERSNQLPQTGARERWSWFHTGPVPPCGAALRASALTTALHAPVSFANVQAKACGRNG